MNHIGKNAVVGVEYVLKNNESEVLDATDGDEFQYLHGANNIIAGLESALEGCKVGDKKQVTIEPKHAYGEKNPELIQKLPHNLFTGIDKVDVGMQFEWQTEKGQPHHVVVTEVEDDGVTIDGNHELAGVTLHFDVTIMSIRAAEKAEIEHGHVH